MKSSIRYKACILGVYVFLIFVHFVLKDRFFPFGIVFYATPLILIILFGFFTSLLYWKRKKTFIMILMSQLLLFLCWINNYHLVTIDENSPNNINSILFWNVAKKHDLPTDVIVDRVKAFSTDMITLVEASYAKDEEIIDLNENLYGYHFKKLEGDMLFGTKGTIDSVFYEYEEHRYKFNHIETTIDKRKTSVLIVDVYASPLVNKEPSLKKILHYAQEKNIDIIVGDFNTPHESFHFKSYATNYTSFHDYGNGFTATWPHHFPLLELDQIWVKPHLSPHRLNKFLYSQSDHKLLIAQYSKK